MVNIGLILLGAWVQTRQFIEHEYFLAKNKIQKPREVLVIVAKSKSLPKIPQRPYF